MQKEQAALSYKPNHLRLIELDQCLRKHFKTGISRNDIITHLEMKGHDTSLRTFARDMTTLKKEFKAPIHNKRELAGDGEVVFLWYYSDLSWTLSSINITQPDLYYLLAAHRILDQYKGLPVAKHLSKAIAEITKLTNRNMPDADAVFVPIAFSPEKTIPVDENVWNIVFRATQKHQHLQIAYDKGLKTEAKSKVPMRTIEPYHIVNLQGTWYLLGSASESNKKIRQYALTRIRNAKVLSTAFTPPPDFDVQKILDVTFGQFIGDPADAVEICVRIKKQVAYLAKERQFSPLESKKTLPTGDLEIRFPAAASGPWHFYHIKSWILSWGADIEVIAPEELKLIVAEEVSKMAASYPHQHTT